MLQAKGRAMKPTPGPYAVERGTQWLDRYVVADYAGEVIAAFRRLNDDEQARANAEAWIAGVAAMGKLERIRQIIEREPLGENLRKLREEIKSELA